MVHPAATTEFICHRAFLVLQKSGIGHSPRQLLHLAAAVFGPPYSAALDFGVQIVAPIRILSQIDKYRTYY